MVGFSGALIFEKVSMSKLFKLKKYFSLTDAANYLSKVLEEQVLVADLYELALEGNLAISIRLIDQAYAKKTAINLDSGLENSLHHSESAPPEETEARVHVPSGIYDLAMIGKEKHEIRELYQQETHGSPPMLAELNGFYIWKDGCIYQFLESLSVSKEGESREAIEARIQALLVSRGTTFQTLLDEPSAAFEYLNSDETEEVMQLVNAVTMAPKERYFLPLGEFKYQHVIRPSELNRFVTSLGEASPLDGPVEHSLYPLEKRSYLNFIRILLHEQKIDPAQRGTSSAISLMSDHADVAISENTIRKILREVANSSD